MRLTTREELRQLYGAASERASLKEIPQLDRHAQQFIALSPFVVLASSNVSGQMDASPRGGDPGFVKVIDPQTLLISDAPGNNRLDTLENILDTGQLGLLFMLPGFDETLRVNGEACISRDPSLTSQFEVRGKTPRTVLVVKVNEVYIHCSRALVRADLWNPAKHAAEGTVPSFGTMLEAQTKGFVEAKQVDEDAITRVPATLY